MAILKELSPEVQSIARHVYYDALRYAYIANTAITAIALIASLFARGKSLQRDQK